MLAIMGILIFLKLLGNYGVNFLKVFSFIKVDIDKFIT